MAISQEERHGCNNVNLYWEIKAKLAGCQGMRDWYTNFALTPATGSAGYIPNIVTLITAQTNLAISISRSASKAKHYEMFISPCPRIQQWQRVTFR